VGAWGSMVSGISGAFQAITGLDETVEQIRQAEKGTVKISINIPKGDLNAAKHGLAQLSEEIVEDEEAEDYVIRLVGGDTIKPKEVSVRTQVRLEASANSVSVYQAWEAMQAYMLELGENGQLDA